MIDVQHGLMHVSIRNTTARLVLVCYTYPKRKHRQNSHVCMKHLRPGQVLNIARDAGTVIEYSDLYRFVEASRVP